MLKKYQWLNRVWAYLPGFSLIILMRLRFVFSPITSDEGGALAMARAWSRGAVLYKDIWADRPQGLFVLYRGLVTIGLGTPEGVRILAIAACLLGAAACGSIASTLVGDKARMGTVLIVGVLLSVPQFEGFIANGELLSCSVGAVALALAMKAVWGRTAPRFWLLYASGVMGGCAVGIKQSGFDAFFTAVVAVGAMSLMSRWKKIHSWLSLPTMFLGFATSIGAMMIHGALTGWYRWWYAIVMYRFELRSALVNADFGRFQHTLAIALPLLIPIFLGVILVGVLEARRVAFRTMAILATWLFISFAAFAMGGQFFRHYWIIMMFPIGTFAGAMISYANKKWLRNLLLAALITSPLIHTATAMAIPRNLIGRELHDDSRLAKDERVAAWFNVMRKPGDTIYPMCASAGLYGNLDIDPPFPYLWGYEARLMPGGLAQLWNFLEGEDAPRFVVRYQVPAVCDASGASLRALHRNYKIVWTVAGLLVYERR